MRFFFRSKQFKAILSVVLIFVTVSIICFVIGGNLSPQANILGTVTAPFRAVVNAVSNAISDFANAYNNGNKLAIKNAELEREISSLREQLTEYEKVVNENNFYKDFLEIKSHNPDFVFLDSIVISTDAQDIYGGFIINKGTTSGISENDPVITSSGLVGYISDVGLTTSKVTTILSPNITLGALDNRTADSGIVSGSLSFAESGMTKFYNLSRSCKVAVGDYVVTSGEGIFPEGILIGTIQSIDSDKYNTSIFASVKPFVDIENLRNVMVITEFEGQGGLSVGSDK